MKQTESHKMKDSDKRDIPVQTVLLPLSAAGGESSGVMNNK